MIEIKGKYNAALVMAETLDDTTRQQIQEFVNHPVSQNTRIAIMADAHAGAGCVVGYTATLGDYVVPALVGVDVGCGVAAFELGSIDVDFEDFDEFIRAHIPSGFSVHKEPRPLARGPCVADAIAVANKIGIDPDRVVRSLGTLGGGNHFIELDTDLVGSTWLVIHSGSRNFGLRVANFWQKQARSLLAKFFIGKDQHKGLEFLPVGHGAEGYLADMQVAQAYAGLNRTIMAGDIIEGYFGAMASSLRSVVSVHNYISPEDDQCDSIVRKGAISAHEDEEVIIPLNMRDGAIIGKGLGSRKWNYSAPHGAGRVLSRKQAKRTLSLGDFIATMEEAGVWSSSVGPDTLDEAPGAYKPADSIVSSLGETVEITAMLKPVYNFKASNA